MYITSSKNPSFCVDPFGDMATATKLYHAYRELGRECNHKLSDEHLVRLDKELFDVAAKAKELSQALLHVIQLVHPYIDEDSSVTTKEVST